MCHYYAIVFVKFRAKAVPYVRIERSATETKFIGQDRPGIINSKGI